MFEGLFKPLYDLYGGYGYYYLQLGVPCGVLCTVICGSLIALIYFAFRDRNERDKLLRHISKIVLVSYCLLLYCSTVVFRGPNSEVGFNFSPFWSYAAIKNGQEQLVMEHILNVLVFIPIGLLGMLLSKKNKLLISTFQGILFSFAIEISQYIFKKGFAELDDVIHNTVGCVFGALFVLLMYKLARVNMKIPKQVVNVNGQ